MNYFWWSQLRRDFLWAYSYRLSFYAQFIGIAVSVYTLFYISKTFELSKSAYLIDYGSNYFLFAIIGLGILDLINLCMRSATKSIRDAQAFGYADIILHAKVSPNQILLASLIYPSLLGVLRLCFYFLLAIIFQDFEFSLYRFILCILLSALILIPFIGLSLLAASFVIVYKQGEPINYATGLAIFLLSGILFPTSVLPSFLQDISQLLPVTHGLEMVRKVMIENSYGSLSALSLLYLLVSSFIMLFIGMKSVKIAVKRMKITGGSGRY